MSRLLPLVLPMLAVLLSVLSGCAPVMVAGGVAGGALLVSDRRSSGAYIEDQALETRISNRISARFGQSTHVNVTSFNRQVLLTGEVPDERTRTEISDLAQRAENVRTVFNETRIAPVSGLALRGQDSWITSQAKTQMLNSPDFAPSHVKIVTEDGVIHLLGLVKRKEGDAAAAIAARIKGARKVVTVFEYID